MSESVLVLGGGLTGLAGLASLAGLMATRGGLTGLPRGGGGPGLSRRRGQLHQHGLIVDGGIDEGDLHRGPAGEPAAELVDAQAQLLAELVHRPVLAARGLAVGAALVGGEHLPALGHQERLAALGRGSALHVVHEDLAREHLAHGDHDVGVLPPEGGGVAVDDRALDPAEDQLGLRVTGEHQHGVVDVARLADQQLGGHGRDVADTEGVERDQEPAVLGRGVEVGHGFSSRRSPSWTPATDRRTAP